MNPFHKRKFFLQEEEKRIIQAIEEAERNTSGEIKVHVENRVGKEDTFEKALEVFGSLNLHHTRQRNGVLFYLAFEDRKFAIVGDSGINEVVHPNFWEDIIQGMNAAFAQKKFTEGLVEGIKKAGEQLKQHFPYQSDDRNEISNEISSE